MPDLALALEERLFNAWPALQTLHVDGWLLRMAKGHTKRANAASAHLPQRRIKPADFVPLVSEIYTRHGIEPIVRITPLTPPAYEAAFRETGWVDFDLTDALTYDLAQGLPEATSPATVTLEPQPSKAWVYGAAKAYELADWQRDVLLEIVGNIRVAAAFLTLHIGHQAVGYGLGVAERGYVGLYDLAIDPAFRNRGIGRQMVRTLMDWGRLQGAQTAYLQVREANEGAQRLYRAMGFRPAYRYVCLRPPGVAAASRA